MLFKISEKDFRQLPKSKEGSALRKLDDDAKSNAESSEIDDKLNALWYKKMLINLQLENARLKQQLLIAENKLNAFSYSKEKAIYVIL